MINLNTETTTFPNTGNLEESNTIASEVQEAVLLKELNLPVANQENESIKESFEQLGQILVDENFYDILQDHVVDLTGEFDNISFGKHTTVPIVKTKKKKKAKTKKK